MGASAFLWAGAAVGAAGSLMGGNATKQAADSEADQTQMESRVRASNIRKLATQTQAAARAGYAASGVTVDEGSAALTDTHITQESELDAFYSVLSGDTRATSLRKYGRAAKTGSLFGAAGSVLGTYAKRPA